MNKNNNPNQEFSTIESFQNQSPSPQRRFKNDVTPENLKLENFPSSKKKEENEKEKEKTTSNPLNSLRRRRLSSVKYIVNDDRTFDGKEEEGDDGNHGPGTPLEFYMRNNFGLMGENCDEISISGGEEENNTMNTFSSISSISTVMLETNKQEEILEIKSNNGAKRVKERGDGKNNRNLLENCSGNILRPFDDRRSEEMVKVSPVSSVVNMMNLSGSPQKKSSPTTRVKQNLLSLLERKKLFQREFKKSFGYVIEEEVREKKLSLNLFQRCFKEIFKGIGLCQIFELIVGVLVYLLLCTCCILVVHLVIDSVQNSAFQRLTDSSTENVARVFDDAKNTVKMFRSSFTLSVDSKMVPYDNFLRTINTFNTAGELEGYQAVEWIPRIRNHEREEYVDFIRENCYPRCDAFSNFTINMVNSSSGEMVPVGNRSEYFPVYYVYPVEGNTKAIGFDLATNDIRRASIEKARDLEINVASARITLVQESGTQYGFLLFSPVYNVDLSVLNASEVNITEIRQESLIGFALGVFRIGDLLVKSVSSLQNIDVVVEDMNGDVLFQTFDFDHKHDAGKFDSEITIGDRIWSLHFKQTSKFLLPYRLITMGLIFVLLIVLTVVYLLISIIFLLRRRRRKEVKETNQILMSHLDKRSKLLETILPKEVVRKLMTLKGKPFAELRKGVSIFFLDICDFTSYCNEKNPENVVLFLNEFFSILDKYCYLYNITKVKTMGDGYLACSGILGEECDQDELENNRTICQFALDVQESIRGCLEEIDRNVRMGINSGKVIAGIVGINKPLFDLWGRAANFASRMESNGIPGKIQVSKRVRDQLVNEKQFIFHTRSDLVFIKGFGFKRLFFLEKKETN